VLGLILIQKNLFDFNFNNLYLVFLALGSLNFFLFVTRSGHENYLKNIFYLLLFVLFFVNLLILILKYNEVFDSLVNSKSLYSIINPNELFLDQSAPRVTGLSRSFAIFNLFLIVRFHNNESNSGLFRKKIYLLFILVLGVLIWAINSRGTFFCYILGLLIYYLVISKLNYGTKIKFLILFIITPILLFNVLILYLENSVKNKDHNNLNALQHVMKTRLADKNLLENYSSGRTELWKYSIKNYDQHKIFGYGPQGDRYLLMDKFSSYGSNVSNGLIYSLLSGGFFGLFFFILLYLNVLRNVLLILLKCKDLEKNYAISTSILFIAFFLLRSTIENSFSVFGTDFLIFITSNILLEQFIKKKIKS